ncbi:TPA: hypothetical protein N0F65_011809 [Lagenidium giganteum]|uniref:Chromatin assembly factor 1 subunit A dimerization domain-containing protein n=1 Tax=Lagenidium giganteum TaxID=4803 RepID=A0AAV2YR57_9STRA|nr:TPA: hypothetical protein N0F65_011809 [Lagenidium giganteum]
MAEQKRKQASIAAFFSPMGSKAKPKAPATGGDNSVKATKRPRSPLTAAATATSLAKSMMIVIGDTPDVTQATAKAAVKSTAKKTTKRKPKAAKRLMATMTDEDGDESMMEASPHMVTTGTADQDDSSDDMGIALEAVDESESAEPQRTMDGDGADTADATSHDGDAVAIIAIDDSVTREDKGNDHSALDAEEEGKETASSTERGRAKSNSSNSQTLRKRRIGTSPAAGDSVVTASAQPKAKRRATKDKVTAANTGKANTSPLKTDESAEPKRIVVADPLVQARIDTYVNKINDLSTQCSKFVTGEGPVDVAMQDALGLGHDIRLELTKPIAPLIEGACALSAAVSKQETEAGKLPAAGSIELNDALKSYISRMIQGRSTGLSCMCKELATAVVEAGEASDGRMLTNWTSDLTLALELEVKMLAQRVNYGVKPPKANPYEDTSADALWTWEVGLVDKYFNEESQKLIKRMRKHRRRVGQQLKSLARVVQLLQQTPIDETKVSAEEAKVSRFVMTVESEVQKARERERREVEKAQALEDKKRLEEEKQQAKLEEKRRKDKELEEEKLQASKRRKSLVSYFRSIDASSTETDAMAPTQTKEEVAASERSELMSRMDREVAFLVSSVGKEPTSPGKRTLGFQALFPSLATRTKSLVSGSTGSWSGRRRRDPKLGIMKFLQFHENYRPAYYGTFSKRSTIFRRGRRPFAQYSEFDYSVDSDDEWEEEEPGESLSDADSDNDDSDDDALDYGDKWLAYEDEVDYMSDTNMDDDDADPDAPRAKQLQHAPGRKGGNKKTKLVRLEPQIIGPYFCDDGTCSEHFGGAYAVQQLAPPQFESALYKLGVERARLRQEQEAAKKAKEAAKAAAKMTAKAAGKDAAKNAMDTASTPASTKKDATKASTTKASPPAKSPAKLNVNGQTASRSTPAKSPKAKKAKRVAATLDDDVQAAGPHADVSTVVKPKASKETSKKVTPKESAKKATTKPTTASISKWLQPKVADEKPSDADKAPPRMSESPQVIDVVSADESAETAGDDGNSSDDVRVVAPPVDHPYEI